jgi:epoxyqueuosine reductase
MNPVVRTIEPDQVHDSAGELKARLQTLAQELGFDLCRIAPANPPAHAGEFRIWLHEGAAGEMGYMERGAEKRCDPQIVLPGARSVIVLSLNYWQGAETRREATGATGRIARYAWGDDYHDVIAA